MKKLPIPLIIFLFLAAQSLAQTWNPLSDTLNGFVTCGVNTGTPNNLLPEALLGGTFTQTKNGITSPLVIKYDNWTHDFTQVTGFDQTTDKVVGFFKRNGSWYAYGKFKVGTNLYYGAMEFNSDNTVATPNAQFQFKGALASTGKIESLGIDTLTNEVIFYGNTLARMGPGSGVNLAAKVGKMTLDGTVTALGALTPTHASENPTILTIGWKNSEWSILGNFEMLGGTSVNDLGTWNGTNVTAINTNTNTDVRCSGYSNGYLGWNGFITDLGVNSPGGLKLNNGNLEALGGGWNIATKHVIQRNNFVWFSGAKQASGSRLATFDVLTSSWTNRQTNLLTVDNDTIILNGIVHFPGDSLMVFGNFNSTNSSIPGGLAVGKVASIALPVELTSFTGRLINGKVLLQWHTKTEHKNRGFKIERANAEFQWTEIDFIAGNGDSDLPQDYSYWDNRPLDGLSYYRLVQMDEDSKLTYLPAIKIEKIITGIKVSPNPAYESILIEIESNQETSGSVDVITIIGKTICTIPITINSGMNETSLSLLGIPSGNYILQITTENQIFRTQLIISN